MNRRHEAWQAVARAIAQGLLDLLRGRRGRQIGAMADRYRARAARSGGGLDLWLPDRWTVTPYPMDPQDVVHE